MKFEIYTSGCLCSQNEKKTAGCAAVIYAIDDTTKRYRRVLAFGLGQTTLNLASLQGARVGLMSLIQDVMDENPQILLQTDNHYVFSLLQKENDEYKINPKANQEQADSLRSWVERAGLVVPVYGTYDPADTGIYECVERAQKVATTQQRYDSGTKEC